MEELREEMSIEIREESEGIALVKTTDEPFYKRPEWKNKCITAAIFLVAGLISFFLIAGWASDPETYFAMNETLDEKKSNVMALAATTTAASAAISILPDDAGSGIADKLADFSTYFMVILAVIYLEKFLLTTFGLLTFKILIPIGCALFIVAVFLRKDGLARVNMQQIGAKILALGIALFLVVPTSVWVTDSIDNSFEASLQASNEAAQAAIQEVEANTQDEQENQEDAGFFENLVGTVQSGINSLTNAAKDALDTMGQQLNNMIDTLAVMIVTSCLVPLIVLALFLQLAKFISGIDFGGVSNVMSSARTRSRAFVSSLKRSED